MNFMQALRDRWTSANSLVCVGLDPVFERIPQDIRDMYSPEAAVVKFCEEIVEATHDKVCAYKPNASFFNMKGHDMQRALAAIIKHIHRYAPGVPVIVDAKRGDIGKSNNGYVEELFGVFNADAATLNPQFGPQANKPFTDLADKGFIFLCRTSNPGAELMQDPRVEMTDKDFEMLGFVPPQKPKNKLGLKEDKEAKDEGGLRRDKELEKELGWRSLDIDTMLVPSYQRTALIVSKLFNTNKNCALVVGATVPTQLAAVRRLVGDMQILAPGIGTQGGDLKATLEAGLTADGNGLIINSSSDIIFAWEKAEMPQDWGLAARNKLTELHEAITTHRLGR